MELTKDVSDLIQQWLESDYDEETKVEIRRLLDNRNYGELNEAFYTNLEFGTGGMRGIMGVGTNRMNRYTVGIATQGFANFLKRYYLGEELRMAISFDNRNNSRVFANVCTDVLTANGIEVHLFNHLRPTPMLSYAVRELNCHGGIMLTASHNPKEYNGYKAYGKDGGQLVVPVEEEVIEEVRKITNISQVSFQRDESLVKTIGPEMDQKYKAKIKEYSVYPDLGVLKNRLSIVYTSLHGTGITMVPYVLNDWGFSQVFIEIAQAVTDGNFATIESPNPEEKAAFNRSILMAETVDADIILATDPDCDRVGVAVRSSSGTYELLSGNQIGSLLVHYVLTGAKAKGKLTGNEFVVKTIVTTSLISVIAKSLGVKEYDVLTGFKYIGQKITELESTKKFLIGGEESYGFLIGEHVRDKDAIISSAIIAEMAAYYKGKGQTLLDALESLFMTYGYFNEKLVSVTRTGKAGVEEILAYMTRLRQAPLEYLGGIKVYEIRDYLSSVSIDLFSGKTNNIALPKSNVLQYLTVEGDIISIRPSGTEPKIKFYCNSKLIGGQNSKDIDARMDQKIEQILSDLIGLMENVSATN